MMDLKTIACGFHQQYFGSISSLSIFITFYMFKIFFWDDLFLDIFEVNTNLFNTFLEFLTEKKKIVTIFRFDCKPQSDSQNGYSRSRINVPCQKKNFLLRDI